MVSFVYGAGLCALHVIYGDKTCAVKAMKSISHMQGTSYAMNVR